MGSTWFKVTIYYNIITCAYGYEGGLVEEMMMILFMFTASLTNAHDMHTVGATETKQRFSNSP